MIINSNSSAVTALKEHFNKIYVIILKHSIYSNYINKERDY